MFMRLISLLLVISIVVIPANAAETSTPASETEATEVVTDPTTETAPELITEATMEQTEHYTEAAELRRDVPLYYQTDYPDTRYGYGTVASSGCGITCLAMAATYLTGHPYYPDELAGYFGGHGENNMQRLEYGSTQLQLPWTKARDFRDVMAALREGNIVIALMGSESIFTDSQHFILLTGLTEDDKILVNDPYAPNYQNWLLKNAFEVGFSEGDILCGFSGGWIYDVEAMPEEPFIYTDTRDVVVTRYPEIHLTWQEQQLLAKVIWVEARGESLEGQQAVAEVIFNRMVSEDFPNTLAEVVYAEGQFPSVSLLDSAIPSQMQYEAFDNALTRTPILPMDVVYFATTPKTNSVWGQIGGHVFCYPDNYEGKEVPRREMDETRLIAWLESKGIPPEEINECLDYIHQ